HLRLLFKSAFGQTIGSYIRSRKMAVSIEDLLGTDLNVLDIAYDYGLGYEQSYIRAFKREYGLTPGEMRKSKSDKIISKTSPLCLYDSNSLTNTNFQGNDTIKTMQRGIRGAYNFETWYDTGSIAMSLTNCGGFKCKWNKAGDAIFRTGKHFDELLTHSQIGNIEVDYGISFLSRGGSYLGVYGWTIDPLVEFYIVENGLTNSFHYANRKANININEGSYEVYEFGKKKSPSIIGINDFKQYWSIRTNNRSSGTVNVSEHFNAWEKLGMHLGVIHEISSFVEGIQSSGAAEVYRNILLLDKKAIKKKSA
ncbi:MAG: glycoside hydrolase family 11 protein, partial [Treponema sp.]|nr:glycoside hydrolase family 11 protein [Treponema sp.]